MASDQDWIEVGRAEDIREGEGFETGVEIDGTVVGVFMIDGQCYAVGECTHERGPICQGHREDSVVACPWHSAKFDVKTGKCVQGPVACRTSGSVEMGEIEETEHVADLQCFDVKIENNSILVRSRKAIARPDAVKIGAE